MAKKTTLPRGFAAVEQHISYYPDWAKELARKYFTKTLTQFILHGNVRNLVKTLNDQNEPDYVSLKEFLVQDLFAGRDIVVFYDRSAGIYFADPESQKDFNRALSGYDTIFGTDYAQRLPKDPVRVFSVLENYFRVRLSDNKRIACVIDFADTVIPMTDGASASSEDRNALVFLQRWASEPHFLEKDFTVCLLTENLLMLNQALVQSPYTADIKIEIPAETQRFEYVNWYINNKKADFKKLSEVNTATLAQQTAGLNFIQLRTILADVLENQNPLTFEYLIERKKELIEAEAYGMLEFIEGDYNLDMVAGHIEAKKHLREAAAALKAGRPDVMPMGYLVNGPVGTGKTFIITCFAGEIGVPMVKLKNFRSQWQGQTEANLEKILSLLQAMTPVAVMIDEADAMLGDRNSEGDSGVSNRVFGQIASFMSNSKNRGKIIWFLLTARPDLMPIDLKRQGRAEEHLALFYPTTREDRVELLRTMMERTKITLDDAEIPVMLVDGSRTFSGADMEAILTRAKFRAVANNNGVMTAKILAETVEDFIPPTYPQEVELQTMAAVAECTSKQLLPEKFRHLEREEVLRRIEEIKMLL